MPVTGRKVVDACHDFRQREGRDLSTAYRFIDYHETDAHIFAHANYFPDIPMSERPVGMLRWNSLRDMTPGPHVSGKTVIVGHTSQKGGEILDLGHLRCIDTNCHGGGWLTALEGFTGKVWQADRDGRMRR